ncbi:MAG: AAC(3) family N-acetyltransferase [Alphaproteobacteria bacterium]
MTEQEAREAFKRIFRDLDVEHGDTLYLGIDVGRVPLPKYQAALTREAIRARERKWCEFIYECLREAIGGEGTLLVPTFTYAYAGGAPYINEETPSETGPFTEYVRTLPGSVRSLHPIHSIAGIGPKAGIILDNVGKAAYGAMSPYARFTNENVKFLCLGTSIGESLTYVHHLEHIYGSNHRYHKVFDTSVSRHGRAIDGPWLCYLRYFGVAAKPRIANIEDELRSQGVLAESREGGGVNQLAKASDVDRVGLAMLTKNPCAFVSEDVRVYLDETATKSEPSVGRDIRFDLNFKK